MDRRFPTLAIATTVASVLLCSHTVAQALPPARKAQRVEITKGPGLESATNHLTIIRWTTNNPGGSDVHYGIVHYGTDPRDLGQTAKNPIRLNQGHQYTTFRVRIEGLRPRTTYYYQGHLGGEQWQERWGEKHRQEVHHTQPRRAKRLP
jgi:hypothetical protein